MASPSTAGMSGSHPATSSTPSIRRAEAGALARRRRACRNGLRRPAPVPDRRGSHPEDRSEDRPRARHDPGARRRRRFGARLGRRHALGRAISRPQDPSDRSRDGGDPAHGRVASASSPASPGSTASSGMAPPTATRATCGGSIRERARFWKRSRCRPARACRASNPTAATGSSAAADKAARCEPCAGLGGAPRRAAAPRGALAAQASRLPGKGSAIFGGGSVTHPAASLQNPDEAPQQRGSPRAE